MAIPSARGPHDSVFVKPGQIVFTVILSGPSSAAIIFANPCIAVFGIVVVKAPGNNCLPVTPETFNILPALDFLI